QADVAHHARQLHTDRQIRAPAYRLGDGGGGSGVVAEVEAALFDVRARDVDLETGDAGHAVEPRGELAVLRGGLAVDVHQDREVPLRPAGRVVANERRDSGTLEADRVEHPARRLDDARRRRAFARTQEDAFGHHRPEGPT